MRHPVAPVITLAYNLDLYVSKGNRCHLEGMFAKALSDSTAKGTGQGGLRRDVWVNQYVIDMKLTFTNLGGGASWPLSVSISADRSPGVASVSPALCAACTECKQVLRRHDVQVHEAFENCCLEVSEGAASGKRISSRMGLPA